MLSVLIAFLLTSVKHHDQGNLQKSLSHGSRRLESIIVQIAWLYVAGMVAETGNQSSYLETQAQNGESKLVVGKTF